MAEPTQWLLSSTEPRSWRRRMDKEMPVSFNFIPLILQHQLPKRSHVKNPSSNSFHGLVGRDPSPNRPHSVSQSEACCLCERGDNICLVGSISQPGLYVDSRILDAGQHNADGFAHIQDRSLPAAPSLCLMEQGKGLDSALKQIQWIPLILLTRFIRGLMLPCQLLQR